MLKNSIQRIGEIIEVQVEIDSEGRIITPHHLFLRALKDNIKAKSTFENLSPSLQLEIVRYISRLKSKESIKRNILKAIDFLLGKGKFVGRDKITFFINE